MCVKFIKFIWFCVIFLLVTIGKADFLEREFLIDQQSSWIHVLVYPDGPLRRFGHHHVVSNNNIYGKVWLSSNLSKSKITLEFKADEFIVDDPILRANEGENFSSLVSEEDIIGTKANMLGPALLDSKHYPLISVESDSFDGDIPNFTIKTKVSIKGEKKDIDIPVHVKLMENRFIATGSIDILHEQLGLIPFTVGGGALSVRDLLTIKFQIVGNVNFDS